MNKVVVFGTFDTKFEAISYLIEVLKQLHIESISVDLGTTFCKNIKADFSNEYVAANAGYSLESLSCLEYAKQLSVMGESASKIIADLVNRGEVQGAISLGGGQGSFLAGIVMRSLPIGLPKVILSTAATRGEKHFAGINDTMIMNSLSDIAGRNPLLDMTIRKAAYTIYGLLQADLSLPSNKTKKRVGITMWGVTTPCVERVRNQLEKQGLDVYVFHANSVGGTTLESLVKDGFLDAVADITLNELTSSRITGEFMNETRLTNAPQKGIPLVVAPGGVDMVNVGIKYAGAEIDNRFWGRKIYKHNPVVVFARSNPDENRQFAKTIADLLNHATKTVFLLLPLKGTSAVNKPEGIFWEPETDFVLYQELKRLCNEHIKIIEMDYNINDPEFADKIAEILLKQLI